MKKNKTEEEGLLELKEIIMAQMIIDERKRNKDVSFWSKIHFDFDSYLAGFGAGTVYMNKCRRQLDETN